MTLPDVTWASVPVWVYVVIGIVTWYGVAARVAGYIYGPLDGKGKDDSGDMIMSILFSPFLVFAFVTIVFPFVVVWTFFWLCGGPVAAPWDRRS